MKDDERFNDPFNKLKGIRLPEKSKSDTKNTHPPKTKIDTPSQTAEPVQPIEEDEHILLNKAMEGVMPLPNDLVVPEPLDKDTIAQQIRDNARRQDKEVIDTLNSLVSGKTRFDIRSTGEYLEGHVVTFDPRVMKQLKAGEFTIQAHLDLHGHIKEHAKAALNSFIQNSHALGYRSLLVIHGRGLKSDTGPVIKEGVVRWLTTGTLSHLVLAFCSARPCDGGTGAMYVLLKKRPVKKQWKRPL